jgi:hypothetical protein
MNKTLERILTTVAVGFALTICVGLLIALAYLMAPW